MAEEKKEEIAVIEITEEYMKEFMKSEDKE